MEALTAQPRRATCLCEEKQRALDRESAQTEMRIHLDLNPNSGIVVVLFSLDGAWHDSIFWTQLPQTSSCIGPLSQLTASSGVKILTHLMKDISLPFCNQ